MNHDLKCEANDPPAPRRASPWFKFAVERGPLTLFFLANARPKLFAPAVAPFLPARLLSGPNGGLFTATLVLMAALGVSLLITRKLPAVPLATALLVFIFGALTLYLQDTSFIKMKPTVLYAAFGSVLLGGLAVNRSLLPVIFDNAVALTGQGWRLLTYRWAGFFFALAAANEIVWRTQSNDVWVAFKFPGTFILILLFSLAQLRIIRRYSLAEEEAMKAPEHY